VDYIWGFPILATGSVKGGCILNIRLGFPPLAARLHASRVNGSFVGRLTHVVYKESGRMGG